MSSCIGLSWSPDCLPDLRLPREIPWVLPEPAAAQGVQLVLVDVAVVGQGYQLAKLLHKDVRNDKGEKIGTLDDLILTSDQKLFSIVQVGGLLGLGGHLVAAPYETLQLSDDGRKIVLPGASKDALKNLPEFHY